MQQKTVIGLAIVTVPVALAALFLSSGNDTTPPSTQEARLFPNLPQTIGGAVKLTVVGPDGSVEIDRKAVATAAGKVPDDGWTLPAKGGYPVQATTVRPVLTGLLALKTVQPMTAQPKLYDLLDLKDPGKGSQSHAVTVADAGGHELAKVIVGRHAEDTAGEQHDGIYVRKPGEAQTWLAKPPLNLPGDALEWIDRKVVDIDTDTVKDVTLAPVGDKPLMVTRAKKEDKLEIQDAPKDAKFKSQTPANDIAAAFRYLDLDDVEPAAQLTAKPIETVHLDTFDGLAADFTLVKQDNSTWVTVAAAGTGAEQQKAEEITRRTKGWAYKIADARATTLESKLADLILLPEKPAEAAPESPANKTVKLPPKGPPPHPPG